MSDQSPYNPYNQSEPQPGQVQPSEYIPSVPYPPPPSVYESAPSYPQSGDVPASSYTPVNPYARQMYGQMPMPQPERGRGLALAGMIQDHQYGRLASAPCGLSSRNRGPRSVDTWPPFPFTQRYGHHRDCTFGHRVAADHL